MWQRFHECVSGKGKNGGGWAFTSSVFGFKTVQIDNSIEQDFLLHEKEIIYPTVVTITWRIAWRIAAELIEWFKILVGTPTFTIEEIEKHRQFSGKIQGLPITKTLGKRWKFRKERFFTTDSIYNAKTKTLLKVKDLCKASMKKDLSKVFLSINRSTSMVSSADCSCPAGKNGYCNHVMAFLLKLTNADYSLGGF